MKKTIEEKINQTTCEKGIKPPQDELETRIHNFGILCVRYGKKLKEENIGDDWDWQSEKRELIKYIRSALLSQHKQDIQAVKKAIPKAIDDPWGSEMNMDRAWGFNKCRQEVLTKIEKLT